jgi:CRISPR-associated protein Cas2
MTTIQNHSEYRALWLFALFDLPTKSREQKRAYTKFRKTLLAQGFAMLQYSVYARYCPDEDSAATQRRAVRGGLPPEGQVRVMSMTDRQFGKMEVYFGEKRADVEDPPAQLMLF